MGRPWCVQSQLQCNIIEHFRPYFSIYISSENLFGLITNWFASSFSSHFVFGSLIFICMFVQSCLTNRKPGKHIEIDRAEIALLCRAPQRRTVSSCTVGPLREPTRIRIQLAS